MIIGLPKEIKQDEYRVAITPGGVRQLVEAGHEVLVEAGAGVAGSFLSQQLVDELIVYQAPCLLGDQARPMVNFNPISLAQQLRFDIYNYEKLGSDLKLTLLPL